MVKNKKGFFKKIIKFFYSFADSIVVLNMDDYEFLVKKIRIKSVAGLFFTFIFWTDYSSWF